MARRQAGIARNLCGQHRRPEVSNHLVNYRLGHFRGHNQPVYKKQVFLTGKGEDMIEDEKLAVDEARKISQHEAVKGAVRNEVHQEIVRSADRLDPVEQEQADAVAERFKHKAVKEVVETETEIERARGVARVSQYIDYLFYLIYGIIGLDIVLDLIGARDSNAFKQFVDMLASPLIAPFRGLVHDPSSGPMQLRLSYIVALIVYLLLHLAVNGLLRLLAHRKTVV